MSWRERLAAWASGPPDRCVALTCERCRQDRILHAQDVIIQIPDHYSLPTYVAARCPECRCPMVKHITGDYIDTLLNHGAKWRRFKEPDHEKIVERALARFDDELKSLLS